MQYIRLSLQVTSANEIVTDVISYYLGDLGYESFQATENGLDAYIPKVNFSEQKIEKLINKLLSDKLFSDVTFDYSVKEIKDQNWNEKWEKNYFNPLIISNQCLIRSSFHSVNKSFKFEIIIDPKMAFGTGHHQTTNLMIQEILKQDLKNKDVLDIGCGTAVLAILASKMNAQNVVAIDFDEWAYKNAKENVMLNNTSDIDVKHGTVNLIKNKTFDFVFANINRNVLLQDIDKYAKALNPNGVLIMSGFYVDDVSIIKRASKEKGLKPLGIETKDNWAAMLCIKL